MSEGKDATQRRVYVLPTELVERIAAYQKSLGLGSEVEAARRLLDEALKQRDTLYTITTKVIAKLKEVRSLREAAKEILADHPLVNSISYNNEDDHLTFTLRNKIRIEVAVWGTATVWDENDNLYDFTRDLEDRPAWLSSHHPKPRRPSEPSKRDGAKPSYELDDDIPF